MNLLSISSGSSGNCYYIGNDNTHILVDVGISGKKVEAGLKDIGIKADELSGILITHEHIDHVKGLGVLARKYAIPIYATGKTICEIQKMKSVGEISDDLFHEITPDTYFNINDIKVDPTSIWHDAADPVCYSLYDGDKKISVATDLGNYDDYIVGKLKDSDVMVIEANHDIRMLQAGPYPYYLKQRILSNYGHLSNERSGQLIKTLLNNHIKGILLGHLSKENNFEELAYETVKLELFGNDYTDDVREFGLCVAKRDTPGVLIEA
ncbi:MAG: MBL fold metallo-hydrolase [Coprococcus sp.]